MTVINRLTLLLISLLAVGPWFNVAAASAGSPDPATWYRLLVKSPGERMDRCVELLKDGSPLVNGSYGDAKPGMLWSNSQAAAADDNYDCQFWQFVPDPNGSGLFAMVNKTIPDGSVNITPTAQAKTGRWTYDNKTRHYGFKLDGSTYGGVTDGGINYYAITSTALISGYWMNIGPQGQGYAVNVYTDPSDASAGIFYFYPEGYSSGEDPGHDDNNPEGPDDNNPEDSITITVDYSTGSLNGYGNFCTTWTSDDTNSGLSIDVGSNNMYKYSEGPLHIYVGRSGSCTININTGTDWYVSEYSFLASTTSTTTTTITTHSGTQSIVGPGADSFVRETLDQATYPSLTLSSSSNNEIIFNDFKITLSPTNSTKPRFDGSISNPYDVETARNNPTRSWIGGYIVGTAYELTDVAMGAILPFYREKFYYIVVADSPQESNPANCMMIQWRDKACALGLQVKFTLNYNEAVSNYRLKYPEDEEYPLWNIEYDPQKAVTVADPDRLYDIDGDGCLEVINDNTTQNAYYNFENYIFFKDSNCSINNNDVYKPYNEEIIGLSSDEEIYSYDSFRKELYRFDQTAPNEWDVKQLFKGTEISWFDYNLDGKKEYIVINGQSPTNNSLIVGADGELIGETIKVMTPEEYAGVRSELKLTSGGEGIPGMGDMFGRNGGGSSKPRFVMFDMNGDNVPDFIDTKGGLCLLNAGDGMLVKSYLYKDMTIRDFNGDGLADILYCDESTSELKIAYQQRDGSSKTVSLNSNARIITTKDIDHDGDIDIVATVDRQSNAAGPVYLLVYENQGNGSFRKRETIIEAQAAGSTPASDAQLGVLCCVDIDADGKYEAIYADNCTLFSQTINSPSDISQPTPLLMSSLLYRILADGRLHVDKWDIVNYDNSGRTAISAGYELSNFNVFSPLTKDTLNQRPSAPGKPTVSYDAQTGLLTVTWPEAKDAETSSVDLTYELRIGTATGLGDIVMAQSLADGRRRVSRNGANGYGCQAVYRTASWPAGKIYISVQAVDANYLGSEFSEEAVFEKTEPAITFNISAPEKKCVRKKIDISLTGQPENGYSYSWDFGEGASDIVIDARANASLIYQTPGRKTIRLTVIDGNGSEFMSERIVDIAPAAMTTSSQSVSLAIDLDGDGNHEIMTSNGIMYENEAGEYELLKKSFNTGSLFNLVNDFDGDGLADGISLDRGNIYVYHNYGDGDMERRVVPTINESNISWSQYDFNNDGKLDIDYDKLNSGDYLSYEETSEILTPRKHNVIWITWPTLYYDFNGDGLIDQGYIANKADGTEFGTAGPFTIFENIDGIHYKTGQPIDGFTGLPDLIDDIDGDGKADFVKCNASYSYGVSSYDEYIAIIWGSGAATTFIQCPDGAPFSGIQSAFDVNNDGVKDLIVTCNGGEKNYVCYVYPDFTSEVLPTYGGNAGSAYARRRNGNIISNLLEIEAAPNQRPTPPTYLRSIQNDKNVVIEWNPGTDAETPSTGLRYNVGIKHKGLSGEGAYIISPMNGGDATCALPSQMTLLNGPRITIPLISIPKGEYEVSVQSVDGQYATSEFSETYILKVAEQSVIEMPASTMIGNPTAITVRSNAQSATVDFGSGAVTESLGAGRYTVTWSSEGMKDIKVNNSRVGQIYVYPCPEMSFELPESVLLNAEVSLKAADARIGQWLVNDEPIGPNASAEIITVSNDSIRIKFTKAGEMTITHRREEMYGVASSSAATIVKAENSSPEIMFIAADANNHYTLYLDPSGCPDDAIGIKIYREGNKYDDYGVIATERVETVKFTDFESRADVKASRYRISYVLPYGESMLSAPHQPIHVQINKGVGNAINLSWSQYEGMQVESYRILRGVTPSSLDVYDVVSGHLNSYSDIEPSVSEPYYAVELVVPYMVHKSAPKFAANEIEAPRSNVVSATDAVDAILATSVGITTSTGDQDVYFSRIIKHQQLSAHFLPVNVTVKRVNWEVVEGDNMTVDQYGNVTATGFGTAVIRASACDGSGVYSDIELWGRVPDDFVFVECLWLDTSYYKMSSTETYKPIVEITPEDAEIKTLKWTSLTPEIVSVTTDGIISAAPGVESGSGYVQVETTDGSGISNFIEIEIYKEQAVIQEIIPSQSEYTLKGGESVKIDVTILPEGASDQKLLWYSMDKSLATVDQNGVVTANRTGKLGTVTISAEASLDVFVDIPVTIVEGGFIEISQIVIDPNPIEVEYGVPFKVEPIILPENATNKQLSWESCAPDVITVDQDGVITALKPGIRAGLIVRATDGSNVYTGFEVSVKSAQPAPVLVSEIICTPETVVIEEGESCTISAQALPVTASNLNLHWSSANPAIASVSEYGVVTALGAGESEIFIDACDESGVRKVVPVTVLKRSGIYSVAAGSVSIIVDGQDVIVRNVPAGDTVRVYTTVGSLLRVEKSTGKELRFHGLNGPVIVAAGGKTQIIVVK